MFDFDRYRDFLVKKLNLSLLSKEEQDEIFIWIGQKIVSAIDENLSEMLGEEGVKEYSTIRGREGDESAKKFLYEKIPNVAVVSELAASDVLKNLGIKFDL